jgi:hypothetical protein
MPTYGAWCFFGGKFLAHGDEKKSNGIHNEYAKVVKFQGRILSPEIVVFRQYFWAVH